jgi:hypothetical protein
MRALLLDAPHRDDGDPATLRGIPYLLERQISESHTSRIVIDLVPPDVRRIVLAALLSSCALMACAGTDACGEGPGPENWVAGAERWMVLGPSALDGVEIPDEDRTLTVSVDAAPVADAAHHGAFTTTTVAIHDSFVPDVRAALEDGATVWLALASTGLEGELVSYSLARFPDGSHRLLGDDCADPANEFLQQRLGDSFDERMEAIVGLTGQRTIAEALRPPA